MYKNRHWLDQVAENSTPLWKFLLHPLYRLYWDSVARREIGRLPYANRVIGERGYNLDYRRRWATHGFDMASSTILVQGTGSGWDVISWASLKPKYIIAVDLFSFDSWQEIQVYCLEKFGVTVQFIAASLDTNFGLDNNSVDLIVSDAVYEHCTNLRAVMHEAYRVLRKSGRVYANYGPLWYCAGGDHFSGRDSISSSYNHLLLPRNDYRDYVNKYKENCENYQDGVRYIELELFSKLKTSEYLDIYKECGFSVEDLWIEVSERSSCFKSKCKEKFFSIPSAVNDDISIEDLMIKIHHVRLRK